MKFKYIVKKAAVLWMVLIMSVSCLTGCGSNTRIVFTTGLSGDQIFKIGSMKCTMPEAMIYLITFYNQYEETYGQEMWMYDFGGVSLEEHVKDVVVSKMAEIKIMNLMAEERNITLSAEEEQKVLEAAECYYEKLEETLKEKEGITKEIAETVYKEYALANKVYETITESADMEISDDEARTVTVQSIFFKNWKMKDGERHALSEKETLEVLSTARKVLGRIKAGEDFETVAAEYSDEKQIVKNHARGELEKNFEEVVFSLDENDVSSVIETEDGYYIVKCISTMDYEATQANKIVLAEQRKKEAFYKAYSEIAVNTHSQFRDKQWKKISLDAEIHCTDADFFEIYDEYVKQ